MSRLVWLLARATAETLGRESWLIRTLRPAYEWLIEVLTLGRGYPAVVNGIERFRVRPAHRRLYPDVYEPAVYRYLHAHVRPGQTCLNIGAAAGVYALSLARWVGPAGRVVAFEPNGAARAILTDVARRNHEGANVTLVSDAVGAAPGTATLYRARDAPYLGRLDEPNPLLQGHHEAVAVTVTTVDAWCEAYGVDPDWIVADIEGYEVAMLEGARRTVARGRGRLELVVETHPAAWPLCGTSREFFTALVAELGLSVEPLQGGDPLSENGVVRLSHC